MWSIRQALTRPWEVSVPDRSRAPVGGGGGVEVGRGSGGRRFSATLALKPCSWVQPTPASGLVLPPSLLSLLPNSHLWPPYWTTSSSHTFTTSLPMLLPLQECPLLFTWLTLVYLSKFSHIDLKAFLKLPVWAGSLPEPCVSAYIAHVKWKLIYNLLLHSSLCNDSVPHIWQPLVHVGLSNRLQN